MNDPKRCENVFKSKLHTFTVDLGQICWLTLKKRILRTEISGNTSKVEFRQMRINKIKKQIREIQAKRNKK